MAFSSVGVADPARPPGLLSLSVIVEVEGEREKVLVRGPRWVSFNSAHHAPSARIPNQKGARDRARRAAPNAAPVDASVGKADARREPTLGEFPRHFGRGTRCGA